MSNEQPSSPPSYPDPATPPAPPRHAHPPPPPPLHAPPEPELTPEQSKALEVIENTAREHREVAQAHGWSFVDLDNSSFVPSPEATKLLSGYLARLHGAFPVVLSRKHVLIAVSDPDDVARAQEIRSALAGHSVRFAYANPYAIRRHIEKIYSAREEADALARRENEKRRTANSGSTNEGDLGRVQSTERSSTSQILDLTIEQALRENASDIHFEPTEHAMEVRIRVDGSLRLINTYPRQAAENLMMKIKVDSPGMRTDNFFIPDSGVMRYVPHGGRGKTEPVDIRVEVTPVAWGSGAVMRLQQNIWRPLDGIGFSSQNEKRVRLALAQPDGVLLATGPTGSGKDLPVSTPVPTPTGWTTMGELVAGDLVIGRDGLPVKVAVAWPVIERPELYRITFADGQSQLAGRDHQWLVRTQGRAASADAVKAIKETARAITKMVTEFSSSDTITAEELVRLLDERNLSGEFRGGAAAIAASIASTEHDSAKPLDDSVRRYGTREALAALARRLRERIARVGVADGCLRMTTAELRATGLLEWNGAHLFAVPVTAPVEYPHSELNVRFYDLGAWLAGDTAFGLAMALRSSGDEPLDTIRFERRLPLTVTRSSIEQREDLVAGVMDHLGEVTDDGSCVLRMHESLLRDDLMEVLRSLGAVVREETSSLVFRTSRTVFRKALQRIEHLPRRDNNYLDIVAVEAVGEADAGYEPTRCITVDSPDRTYLCGSGYLVTSNTTLMYSLVNERIAEGTKIVTLENPIEYTVPRLVEQISVNFEQGMTFASGLRSILRRDPDVILLGEIRDRETAETAIDAAMTGHLLLSTLHTNDAPGVVPRLLRMGIEPFLLSSSLLGVVGQRLVKVLCDNCKVEVPLTEEMVEVNSFDPVGLPSVVYEQHDEGCEGCREGFTGRVPVHEVLLSSEELSDAIAANAPQSEIARIARVDGMTTMREDGWEKVKIGKTTLAEINNSTRRKLV